MMEIEEWIPKYYRPPVFTPEDECQDPDECRRRLKKDQREKYDAWVALHTPKEERPSVEENRIVDKLRNSVTLHENGLRNKSRAEYMRAYRRKPKFCPHCKKQI